MSSGKCQLGIRVRVIARRVHVRSGKCPVTEPTICDSAEDMLAAIRHANNTDEVKSNSVVGSLDVKALYPSLELDFAIDIVCEEFYKSGITIQDVDHQELGLYLSLCRSEQYLAKMGILKYCPRRRNKRGAGSGININKGERFKTLD